MCLIRSGPSWRGHLSSAAFLKLSEGFGFWALREISCFAFLLRVWKNITAGVASVSRVDARSSPPLAQQGFALPSRLSRVLNGFWCFTCTVIRI